MPGKKEVWIEHVLKVTFTHYSYAKAFCDYLEEKKLLHVAELQSPQPYVDHVVVYVMGKGTQLPSCISWCDRSCNTIFHKECTYERIPYDKILHHHTLRSEYWHNPLSCCQPPEFKAALQKEIESHFKGK